MPVMNRHRIVIDDFVEDLNYSKKALFISAEIDGRILLDRLKQDQVNKLWRYHRFYEKRLSCIMIIENCDLDILSPSTEMFECVDEGYSLYLLRFDGVNFYLEDFLIDKRREL